MQSLFKQKGKKRGTVFGRDRDIIMHFSPEIKVKLPNIYTGEKKGRLCYRNATYRSLGLFFYIVFNVENYRGFSSHIFIGHFFMLIALSAH